MKIKMAANYEITVVENIDKKMMNMSIIEHAKD